jgi:hypothetical protein
MVRDYTLHCGPWAQEELEIFSSVPFDAALKSAALAEDGDRKRFSHQRRLKWSALRKSSSILVDAANELRRCKSFDQLHNLLSSAK